MLWNGAANPRGSAYERLIADLLQRPVAWSARHVRERKSWAEVLTAIPGVGE